MLLASVINFPLIFSDKFATDPITIISKLGLVKTKNHPTRETYHCKQTKRKSLGISLVNLNKFSKNSDLFKFTKENLTGNVIFCAVYLLDCN